jgi:holin-like protein
MLGYLTVIFCCQLVGELLATALALPVPGPVCGMAILFVGLVIRGEIPKELGDVAGVLLGNLSLLFIPAGVGVMLHATLLSRDWLPISLSLVFSTLVTIAVTALMMSWLMPAPKPDKPEER